MSEIEIESESEMEMSVSHTYAHIGRLVFCVKAAIREETMLGGMIYALRLFEALSYDQLCQNYAHL